MTAKTPPNLDEVCEAMRQGAAEIERLNLAVSDLAQQLEDEKRQHEITRGDLLRTRLVRDEALRDLLAPDR